MTDSKDGGATIADHMPKDGSQFYVTYRNPCRWKPYKPTSQQYKHGKRGRWQLMNEYCGWENAPHNFDPVDFQARSATPPQDTVRDELVEAITNLSVVCGGIYIRGMSDSEMALMKEAWAAVDAALSRAQEGQS